MSSTPYFTDLEPDALSRRIVVATGVGALLCGDGELGFVAVPALESGIVMPEDAVAVAAIDIDGDGAPDFVCATNDGPLRAYRATGERP